MARSYLNPILDNICRMAADAGGVSDAGLLERFVAHRDEAAFELLIWRHARLVFGVCRRVLPDYQDAEDAFQATFLTLARKAGRITRGQAVASWLYKVAYRVALTARGKRARQTSKERPLDPAKEIGPAAAATAALEHEELRAVLDQEVGRLPRHYQAAVVLCYLEGKTVDEAAVQLGCPRGTVASRLARARQRLQTRLAGRGLALAAGLTIAAETGQAAPLSLIPSLLTAAVRPTAGATIPLRVAALSQEVLKAMFLHKLRVGGVVVVLCALALLAAVGLGKHLYASAPSESPPARETAAGPPGDKGKTLAEDQPADKPALHAAKVRHPVRHRFTPSREFTGHLEPLQTVEVRARISGDLLSVNFKPGANVKKGELLFVIDARDLQLALNRAEANLRQAEAKRKQAAATLQRMRRQHAVKAVSQEDLDQATADAEVAEAALQAAAAELKRAQLTLGFAKVTAPIAGRIGQPQVTPGNQVSGTSGRATLLATIKMIDPIGVVFDMDERSFLDYQGLLRKREVKLTDTPLFIGLTNENGFAHEGLLTSFSDHVNPRTGTVQVRGQLPNRDRVLLPGMFVRVRLPFGKPRTALAVPSQTVGNNQGKHYVLVVNGRNQVEQRQVKLGQMDNNLRIIEQGLTAADWVVDNPAKLRVGETVDPQR